MNPALPKKLYQAILFDCDGTLTDSMPVHYVAWHKTMTRYGIRFPEDQFYALGGMPTEQIIRKLSQSQNITIDAYQVAMEKEQAFVELLHLLDPIPDVVAVAQYYLGKIPLAVASGGFRDIVGKQLHQIGCANWFGAIVTAEDTALHKPHPDVFLEAARRLKVAPEHCLVYEDSDFGLQAARSANMDYIDVRSFHSPKRIPIDVF